MAHVRQVLTIAVPEPLMDHLHYSTEGITAASGYCAGAAEVYSADGTSIGVLAYFPSCSLTAVQGDLNKQGQPYGPKQGG